MADPKAREGGCFCGQVRYAVADPPVRVTHCHCLHCRRTSGAPFLTWAEYRVEQFAWTRGRPVEFPSREGVTRSFCGACGTPLTYRTAEDPGEVDVTLASFDDPAALRPEDHVWTEREIPWARLQDGLPRYRFRRQDG